MASERYHSKLEFLVLGAQALNRVRHPVQQSSTFSSMPARSSNLTSLCKLRKGIMKTQGQVSLTSQGPAGRCSQPL